MVMSTTSPDQPIYIHSNAWRHYTSNLPAGTAGGYSTLVPARFASLKSLVLCPRRGADINANVSYSVGSRVNPQISSYWWRLGPNVIPSKSVTLMNGALTGCYAEGFLEIQRAWHSVNSAANASCMPSTSYNICDGTPSDPTVPNTKIKGAVAVGTGNHVSAFAIAQELESFSQRTDVLLSGTNCLSSQIFFESNILKQTSGSYTLDFFANFDQILVLERGLLSVRF
jgi:hypothetical protein